MNTEAILKNDRRRLAMCLAVAGALHAVVLLNVDLPEARLPDPMPAIEIVLRQAPFPAPTPFSDPRPEAADVEAAGTGEVSVPDVEAASETPPIAAPEAAEPLSAPSETDRDAELRRSVLANTTSHDLARNKRERERKGQGAVGPIVAGVAGPEAGPAHSEAKRGAGYGALARAIATQAETRSAHLDASETRGSSPRVRRLSGPPSGDAELAYYLDSWRRKVERVGNINYPSEARARGLSGTLRLLVVIDREGALKDARILESSGHELLDEGAVRIVNLAAPFSPFTKNMRSRIDLLEIERRWRFRKDRLTPMP